MEKTRNRIIIENPPKKVLDFVMKVQKENDFNPLEFEGVRQQAGLNAFTLSPSRWIESTNAIGIISQSGRYGGTYAQTDIAFEFASWISVEFRLYLVKEFQRLKTAEQQLLGWTAKRELSKIIIVSTQMQSNKT